MHIPALLEKTIEYLDPQAGEHVIDCTAGAGGHLFQLADRVGSQGKVLAIDWDEEALQELKAQIQQRKAQHVALREGNYADIAEIAQQEKFRPVHKILFDLGFSSDQIEKRKRGFSFQKTEPLDMRYSAKNPLTAEKIVNFQSRIQLERMLKEYGEEQYAKQIAQAIVETRKQKPITTTSQLVAVIESALPRSYPRKKIHPATKTFQALRIAANRELENLEQALRQAEELLEPKGRIAILTFHSLEDRIVKRFFQQSQKLTPVNKKPITPTPVEIKKNPRARSAKLRVAVKQ